MAFRIYPSVGIARLGNHPSQYYIGPEAPGHPGLDVDAQGNESTIEHYKVGDDQIKRQAARFRIFDVPDDGGAPIEVQLPAGATVEWTVHLVNKKAAIKRPSSPPLSPQRPQFVSNPVPLLIDPVAQQISGVNASGKKFDTGEYQGRQVPLGELRTDRRQNLLVLGGFGFSSSPSNAGFGGFYTNPGWHDDTSDGPVTARIRLSNGSTIDDIVPAWVVVAPPDFAPEIQGVVTLYDIMYQVGIDSLDLSAPPQISFTKDVFPLLLRTRRLQWVNTDPNWSNVSDNWPALANPSAAATPLREENAGYVRETESVLSRVKLTSFQKSALDRWVAGSFVSDWAGMPNSDPVITADGTTRATLQSTVGRGFFPGIEAGIITMDASIYSRPFDFRVDHGQVKPGDLTALMALPWQADFWDCRGGWWPSQRPDDVRPVAASENRLAWHRGAEDYILMVHNFPKLGFITAQRDAQGNVVFAEDQRAPQTAFA